MNGGDESNSYKYGDVEGYSGKGPTPVGKPKPDLVATSKAYADIALGGVNG